MTDSVLRAFLTQTSFNSHTHPNYGSGVPSYVTDEEPGLRGDK